MIKYLSYVGPKDEKRIDLGIGHSVLFPKGQVVDVTEAGMSEQLSMDLLKSGLFKLHESGPKSKAGPVPAMEPERNICACGFVAKSKAGLKAHQRSCS